MRELSRCGYLIYTSALGQPSSESSKMYQLFEVKVAEQRVPSLLPAACFAHQWSSRHGRLLINLAVGVWPNR